MFTYLTQTTDNVSIGKNTNSGNKLEVNGTALIYAGSDAYAMTIENDFSDGKGLYILSSAETTSSPALLIESGVLGGAIFEINSNSSYGYIKMPAIPPAGAAETKILK